jgi:hypothetical protein
MALDTYKEASAWSEAIREALDDGRMPPWHADPRYGHWANDRSLSSTERESLLGWIDANCPQGNSVDSPGEGSGNGWRIKPDVIIEMPEEQIVPAAGQIPYHRVVAPTGFKEDVWVSAIEVRPGNRKAVHHILTFATRPDGELYVEYGFLAAYLPGDDPMVYPSGYAKRIPAGKPIVFQVHYVATGKPEVDRSSIGLVLAKEPVEHEVRSINVEANQFAIPPDVADFALSTSRDFDKPVELLSFTPHMHLRGKDFRYSAVHADGRDEVLLSVPRYDFDWQTTYRLAEPLQLAAGSRVECVAHFDNSSSNPRNPDPTQVVRRGEETFAEMMIGFMEYAVGRDPSKASPLLPVPAPLTTSPPIDPWLSSVPWLIVAGGLVACVLAIRLLRRRPA